MNTIDKEELNNVSSLLKGYKIHAIFKLELELMFQFLKALTFSAVL